MGLRRRWRDEYLLSERGLSPETVRAYEYGLRRVERFLGKPIQEVETSEVRRYLRESADPPRTKHLTLAGVKSFHRFECLEADRPMNGIMALRAPRFRPVPREIELTPADGRRLLDMATHPAEVRVVYLPLLAGARITGASQVKGWTDRVVLIEKGIRREVPVHPELDAVKDALKGSEFTSVGALRWRAGQLSKRLGKSFAPHDLRRLFARMLDMNGTHERIQRDILGHSQDVTNLYAPASWQRKVEAILGVSY